MRMFQLKTCARHSRRESVSDKALADAVARAEDGLVDADLGRGLIKQRVARPGGGRSGGFRYSIASSARIAAYSCSGLQKAIGQTRMLSNSRRHEISLSRGFRPVKNWSNVRSRRANLSRCLMAARKPSRLVREMLETSRYMRGAGILDEGTHDRIFARHGVNPNEPASLATPLSAFEIRALRETANLSQAAFARRLNVTAGNLSKWERGDRSPAGAALVLLNVIRRQGIAIVT